MNVLALLQRAAQAKAEAAAHRAVSVWPKRRASSAAGSMATAHPMRGQSAA